MNIKETLPVFISPGIYRQILNVAKIANERNQKIALVGGAVRDVLLNRSVFDADVMLESPVKPVVEEWVRRHPSRLVTHDRFLTFSVYFEENQKIDVVTAREEIYPSPAQLPTVTASTIEKDLRRRDFTINAVVCWLTSTEMGKLFDPFFGVDDLKNKKIRALHAASFVDDPTRIYRAARFAGRLGFEVVEETKEWILDSISNKTPELLTPVRRRHEFELILKEENPVPVLRYLENWAALPFLHKEWTQPVRFYEAVFSRFTPPNSGMSLLLWRMALWFRPWGKDKALHMMTDLAFEKETKRDVLALI